MPHNNSSGQSGNPAEASQLALWPAATAPVMASAFQVANAWLPLGWVSGTPSSQPQQLFGPCCPSQRCLLDHRLKQEPIPVSPAPTLTGMWLMQSRQALWRARQDKSQAWWWSSVSYWPLSEVVCCRDKTSCLAAVLPWKVRRPFCLGGEISVQCWGAGGGRAGSLCLFMADPDLRVFSN